MEIFNPECCPRKTTAVRETLPTVSVQNSGAVYVSKTVCERFELLEGDGIEFGRDNGHVFMRITLEGFRLKKKNKGGLRTSNPALAGLVGTYMVADEAEKDGWYFLAPQARRGRKAKVA